MEQLQLQKVIEEFQQSFIKNSLKYYTEADIHVDFFRILEKELSRRNCLFFDEQNKQSVLHREYPTFNRLLKYKHVLKNKNELYVPQREIKENEEWEEKLKKQDRGHFDIVIWDPDQSWMLNELRDKSSYQHPKKCYFKGINNNMVPYNPVKYAFELKFNRLGTELFRELYNDFYKLSLRNGHDNEGDICEGYLIYSIRKSPVETSKFTGKSYHWERYFLSNESYFLDKLMNISNGRNLHLETNFTLSEQIKLSGTKTEDKNRAFADEIVKKLQMVWEDSLDNNPQKKINIAITVSTTKRRGI
ncbi:MAG: hypothetical protein KAT65_25490 [Methanophagales archaeon]|nr:hypothetical protein [Methanophagales archaeon]